MNLLSRQSPTFPPVERALADPNGLLAVGGALNAEWLTTAYRRGIFPWFDSDDGPILWWCPDPRAVIRPSELKISRSLAKRLRNGGFTVTADTAFSEVISGCAAQRAAASAYSEPAGSEPVDSEQVDSEQVESAGTWITAGMQAAYEELHRLGLAHSIEVWHGAPGIEHSGQALQLVGGLYGVSLGRMFFGESMFSRMPDASKVALAHLARQLERWAFWLIDCQIANPHLTSLGAVDMPRDAFIALVEENADQPSREGVWQLAPIAPDSWRKQP